MATVIAVEKETTSVGTAGGRWRATMSRQALRQVPVSATKSMHGHLMGAAGAIEAIATVLALRHDALPPTLNLDTVDPACAGVRHIVGGPLRDSGARVALSNSFAFGGSNAVLAFRKADAA